MLHENARLSSPLSPSAARGPAAWRLALVLWLCGLPGVAALVWTLWAPLQGSAPLLPLSPVLVLALSALQTAAFVALAAVAGAFLAPRVGLAAPVVSSWLAGQTVLPALRRVAPAGVVGGVAGAAWLVALTALAPAALAQGEASGAVPWFVRILYGGITEEVLLRWGAMSTIAWALWRVFQRGLGRPSWAVMAAAMGLSALLFAAGHLPAAQALAGGLTPEVLAFVLVGNGVFGMLAAVLFARYGLEAAIIAHALAHALAMLV